MELGLGKSAKSIVNELYQKQIKAPTYVTTKDSELPGATFSCQIELPAIVGAFVGARLKGTAKSKKVAEQNAAESALRYIHEKAEWILLGKTSFAVNARVQTNAAATETQLQHVVEELRLVTKKLQKLQGSTTSSSETSSEEQLSAELEAMDQDGLGKPELMQKLAELEQENRLLRVALAKEYDLRKQVAALLTSQPTSFASDLRQH